jgi:hypothetical protein
MRACAMALVFALGAAVSAEDKAAVKEIDLKDLKVKFVEGGKADKPAEIKSADDLKKNDALKDAAEEIGKKVDFSKEKLVLFWWGGSGGDKIAADAKTAGTFNLTRGLTRDFRMHVHLFAVPKDADVKVVPAGR